MRPGDKQHVALWDAINEYADACRAGATAISPRRMNAVARVESVLQSIRRSRKPPADDGSKYTFGDLLAALQKLTPEQLAYPAYWFGDEKGGRIEHLHVETEDHINPSGDMAEPVSLYLNPDGTVTEDAIACDMTAEDVAAEERVAVVGQPFLSELPASCFR